MNVEKRAEQGPTLKDQGYRFMVAPDRIRCHWCHPVEIPVFYADWSDHTDTPEKEFIEFLQDLSESPVDVPSESR